MNKLPVLVSFLSGFLLWLPPGLSYLGEGGTLGFLGIVLHAFSHRTLESREGPSLEFEARAT